MCILLVACCELVIVSAWNDQYKDLEEVAAFIFRAEEFLPSDLRRETSGSFETLLFTYQTKRHDIAQDHNFNTICHENLDRTCISVAFRFQIN